jgi:hypothetical protein
MKSSIAFVIPFDAIPVSGLASLPVPGAPTVALEPQLNISRRLIRATGPIFPV